MKLFTACLGTETNTFSPFVTGFRTFEQTYLARGGNHGAQPNAFAMPLITWRNLAQAQGWTVVESLCAFAQPSGVTLDHVYTSYRDEILADLHAALPVDMVLLSLHGAMVAQSVEDCEGDLIAAVRSVVGPSVPIGVELDLHCHLTHQMVQQATVIVLFKEYPHTDFVERAVELFTLIVDTAQGKIHPQMSLYDCGLIGVFHTTKEPMQSFVAHMKSLEGNNGVLSVSLAHCFPWGDVAELGARLLVVTDNQPDHGASLAQELGRQFYELRTRAQPTYLTIDAALDEALATDGGPVVLADVSDNAGGGAPNDSTFILRALLAREIINAGVACIWDPMAVELATEAGEGATFALRLGGKMGPMSGDPLDLRVTVTKIVADAVQTVGQPPDTALSRLGDAVALEVNGIAIVVNSKRTQTFNPDAFSNLGIDPTQKKILVVKSMQHFYAGFAPIAAKILYVAAPGALVPDFKQLPYQRANRALWPLAEGEHNG